MTLFLGLCHDTYFAPRFVQILTTIHIGFVSVFFEWEYIGLDWY